MRTAGRKNPDLDKIIAALNEHYGNAECYLQHENAWQLLTATILSAQCTDARVNIVTDTLFKKYQSPQALAGADIHELENDIKATGFYHNKAKNIKACAAVLVERYNGEVPSDIDELTVLPGVGRKTANVISSTIYHIPSVVVDTHVKRISGRLGLTESDDPVKIEKDLMKVLPEESWSPWNLQIIALGREICKAPKPLCEKCFLTQYCPEYKKLTGRK